MDADNLKLLQLIYIIPTYFLYILILYLIFFSSVKAKFSAPFYQLFGTSVIFYVMSSIIYYLNFRMPKIPYFIPFVKTWGTRSFFITTLQVLNFYLASALFLSNLFIAFNRFSVFILAVKYAPFWSRNLKFLNIFTFLFPICLVWHIPFTDIYMAVNNESDPMSLRYITEGNAAAFPWMNNPNNEAAVVGFTSIVSFFMNLYVIVKLLQQRFCSSLFVSHGKVSPQDIQMCIYTFLVFITEILYLGTLITFHFLSTFEAISVMFEVQNYLADICTLAPAWFILVTNKPLRKELAIMLHLNDEALLLIPTLTSSTVNNRHR